MSGMHYLSYKLLRNVPKHNKVDNPNPTIEELINRAAEVLSQMKPMRSTPNLPQLNKKSDVQQTPRRSRHD